MRTGYDPAREPIPLIAELAFQCQDSLRSGGPLDGRPAMIVLQTLERLLIEHLINIAENDNLDSESFEEMVAWSARRIQETGPDRWRSYKRQASE